MKRVGIFGGTFDPVHYGHLLLAETCREELKLDEVRFICAGDPPHKTDRNIVDGHTRADMLELAISGCREFVVDRREIRRQGPSFTVDTLTELRKEQPDTEFFFLMGADSVRDLLTWKDPPGIVNLATIAAVSRPGLPVLDGAQIVEWVGPDIASRVMAIPMPGTDISASELRIRVREGKTLRFLTPRAVEVFIREHNLYRMR